MVQGGGACYGTVGAAATAAAAAEVGHVLAAGGVVYVVEAAGDEDGSIAYTLHEVGGSGTVTKTVQPAWQDCQLLTAGDGLAIAWGIVGVWLAAWGLLALRKALP